jgi:hypothetical protein
VDKAFRRERVRAALINKSSNCFGGLPALLRPISFEANEYLATANRARRTVMFGFPESK